MHSIRAVGSGACPIPFSEAVSCINFYCSNDYDFEDRVSIMELFQVIESTWLSWAREAGSKEGEEDSNKFLPTKSKNS